MSITGIIIAVTLSLVVYFGERRNVANTVNSHALEVAAKFNEQINTLLAICMLLMTTDQAFKLCLTLPVVLIRIPTV